MKLNGLATRELMGKEDFKIYGFAEGMPIINDICYSHVFYDKIKGESFRFSNKVRFSY